MELVFVKVIPASYQLQFQTALNDLFQAVFLLMDGMISETNVVAPEHPFWARKTSVHCVLTLFQTQEAQLQQTGYRGPQWVFLLPLV